MAPCPTPCGVSSSPAPRARGLEVRVHREAGDFTKLAPAWRPLMAASRHAHPFYDPAWHLAWWRHLGSGTLHICTVHRPDGALAAVAPFVVSDEGLLRLTGGEDLSDYLDIVAADGSHAEVWAALLAHLHGPEAPAWSEMFLRGLPDASPTRAVLADPAGPAGGRAVLAQEDVCPVIALPDSWDDYMGMLSTRDERDLRRKIRKAQMETGLEFASTLSEDRIEADLDTFVRLHALSHPEKAEFWNEDRGRFFREMAREMLRLGWLDLSFLRVDGHAAAANFSFDYEDRIYLYNSGYDPYEAELSGGLVLLAHNIEDAIQGGRKAFDMLRGDEAYKYRFGAVDEPVWTIRLAREGR